MPLRRFASSRTKNRRAVAASLASLLVIASALPSRAAAPSQQGLTMAPVAVPRPLPVIRRLPAVTRPPTSASATLDLTLIGARSFFDESLLPDVELSRSNRGESKPRVGGWIDLGFSSGSLAQ